MTRDQERAQTAYNAINAITSKPQEKDDYGRFCVRLPALLQQCGLCQTLAFLQAKKQNQLINDLASAMKTKSQTLLNDARNSNIGRYFFLSREAMACAQWFKRYSEAILKIDMTSDN